MDGKIKIFSRVFQDLGKKYGRETVFSTLGGVGNYWKKEREVGLGNHKKRYLDIWTSLKKHFTLVRFLEHFEDLKSQNVILFLYFINFNNVITNIGTFDVLQEEEELVFIAFWQTFFKLPSNTFKI